MIEFVNVRKQDVAAIVAATFPDYRGRKIRIGACEKIRVHNLNWSGGSRSQYRACTLAGEWLGGLDRYNAMAPWENLAEGQVLPTVSGACVVEHSMFCGKDTGLRIYVHPSDMPKLLQAVED